MLVTFQKPPPKLLRTYCAFQFLVWVCIIIIILETDYPKFHFFHLCLLISSSSKLESTGLLHKWSLPLVRLTAPVVLLSPSLPLSVGCSECQTLTGCHFMGLCRTRFMGMIKAVQSNNDTGSCSEQCARLVLPHPQSSANSERKTYKNV